MAETGDDSRGRRCAEILESNNDNGRCIAPDDGLFRVGCYE